MLVIRTLFEMMVVGFLWGCFLLGVLKLFLLMVGNHTPVIPRYCSECGIKLYEKYDGQNWICIDCYANYYGEW